MAKNKKLDFAAQVQNLAGRVTQQAGAVKAEKMDVKTTQLSPNITQLSSDENSPPVTVNATQLSTNITHVSDTGVKHAHTSTKATQLSIDGGDSQSKPERKHRNFTRPRELKTERGNFCLTNSTFAKLREIANATNQSLSTVVDKAIARYYEYFTTDDS